MFQDAHGLDLTCASQAAADAFDHAIEGYLRNRNDASQRLKKCLSHDPEFCMAHVLRGYLTMTAFNSANLDYVRRCLSDAQKFSASVSPREKAHLKALEYLVDGDADQVMAAWDAVTQQWPHDVLAFRLHHFLGFWLGRPQTMLALVERVLPHWSSELPGYGAILACRAFAHEECGSYVIAEYSGRSALQCDAGDIWATHAIAHVYEMQGRRSEGLELIQRHEANWDGGNNLLHHLWWHQALFHYDRGEFDAALDLYDAKFRDLDAPLTQQMPDLYIDMQNAISMLYRLEHIGLDGGERWTELAELAHQRKGDGSNPFTLPHWALALTRTGQFDRAQMLIDDARHWAATAHDSAAVVLEAAAIPVCEAMLKAARGETAEALDVMRPALGHLHLLGGSHAQQDVLELFYAKTALTAQADGDLKLIMERVRAKRPSAPEDRAAWKKFCA